MAQSTAALTYDAVGNKEDILDLVVNISPKETPMFSAFGKVKAKGTYHKNHLW